MSKQHRTSERDEQDIVWLEIDKGDSGANVLSAPVFAELDGIISDLNRDTPRGVVIWSGKPNGFIMGADINEFTSIESPDQAYKLIRGGQQVLDRLASLPCPSVAVINGFALGGGLELAMACRYRIAIESTERILGLPEVQLGIHPGFGGTVRAVEICGVRPALELMLTGKPIDVKKGRRIGLIDELSSAENWRTAASRILTANPAQQRAPLLEKLLSSAPVRPLLRRVLHKQVAAKARQDHYPAPFAIVDLWARYGAKGAPAYEAEARSIAELMCTDTARNLVRVFFLQNKLKSQGSKGAPRVNHVHVVGAGVMGGDIAAWCALKGLDVSLQDRELKYVEPALERAGKLFAKRTRGEQALEETRKRLKADIAGDGAASADLVIEAIFENREAKQALYETVQKKMKAGAVLATNTSSIRLEDLSTVLEHPARFVGLHFFNPVAQMPLIEIIRTKDTDQSVLDIAFGFARAIGKLPLECNSSPGFVVNRILAPYTNEALLLMEEGVNPIEIDRAAENFGMPMGPIELLDSVGIDVAAHVAQVLGTAYQRPIPTLLQRKVDAGELGRKTGQGFYRWVDGKVQKHGTGQPAPNDTEDRLILPMINEAVACLSEQVVTDGDLLDAGVIFGTGFAPFRGGPLHYAHSIGAGKLKLRLESLAAAHGQRFLPHDGWSNL
jgi:3-hydroxyacyl-CoA dehydrogenase/enoyl-CoA hydratase/3-hydroxybutyryl-CoA epimerase